MSSCSYHFQGGVEPAPWSLGFFMTADLDTER